MHMLRRTHHSLCWPCASSTATARREQYLMLPMELMARMRTQGVLPRAVVESSGCAAQDLQFTRRMPGQSRVSGTLQKSEVQLAVNNLQIKQVKQLQLPSEFMNTILPCGLFSCLYNANQCKCLDSISLTPITCM